MDYPNYKTEYIDIVEAHKKWYESKPVVTGRETAGKLEKLILEYDEAGYDLLSTEAIQDFRVIHGSYAGTYTKGIIAIFKKRAL